MRDVVAKQRYPAELGKQLIPHRHRHQIFRLNPHRQKHHRERRIREAQRKRCKHAEHRARCAQQVGIKRHRQAVRHIGQAAGEQRRAYRGLVQPDLLGHIAHAVGNQVFVPARIKQRPGQAAQQIQQQKAPLAKAQQQHRCKRTQHHHIKQQMREIRVQKHMAQPLPSVVARMLKRPQRAGQLQKFKTRQLHQHKHQHIQRQQGIQHRKIKTESHTEKISQTLKTARAGLFSGNRKHSFQVAFQYSQPMRLRLPESHRAASYHNPPLPPEAAAQDLL